MKHVFLTSLFFIFLVSLIPISVQGEVILFEDEDGKVIMQDSGEIHYQPAQNPTSSPSPLPYESNTMEEFPFPDSLPFYSVSSTVSTAPSCTAVPSYSAPSSYTRNLTYGDNGRDVEALQERLATLGYYHASISGGYYKVTRQAVRSFQSCNGLPVDGIAGEKTQSLLFSAQAIPAWATPAPSPTPLPTRYTLMVDVTNQIVRAYTYDADGQYTVLVREMICSTGTAKNPTPLGTTIMPKKRARWGYFPTWDSHAQYLTRIDASNAFHSVLYNAPHESALSKKSFQALGTPVSHGCVRLYVCDAKWIYDNCSAGTIITVYEGDYDPEYTMTLCRELDSRTQRECDLPQATPQPVYSHENWPTHYRTLSRGSQGSDVYMLQMRLRELGYYNGSVTGGYYGGTIQAVKAFQRDHRLQTDGVAGSKTQSLLFADSAPASTEPIPSISPSPTATPTSIIPTATPVLLVVPEHVPLAPIDAQVG